MIEQIKSKIQEGEDLQRTLSRWRFKNYKIVFTNGCFDLLHPGHINYLCAARKLGNRLVIGLNADDSVKKLKGENRPVNAIETRSVLLAAMVFVDAIVVFDEATPAKLIEAVKPDILVKGGDYDPSEIVGADFVKSYGGQVATIPFVEGYSSSKIIEKCAGA